MKTLFFAANLVLLALTSFAVQAIIIAPPANTIWVATDTAVQQMNSDTDQIVTTLILSGVGALAVDAKDSSLLALTGSNISKFSGSTKLWEKAIADFGLSAGTQLFANPFDSSMWLVSGKRLVRLDSEGKKLTAWNALGSVKSFSLALDESLWLLGENQIWHYSPSGALLANRNLSGLFGSKVKQIAVDSLGTRLWIASENQLAQFDLADLNKSPQIVSLTDKVVNIALEPLSGTLWVLGAGKLLGYASNAALIYKINLVSLGISTPASVAYDPLSKYMWVGDANGVAKFSKEGTLLSQISLTEKAGAIGVPSFYVTPAISLIQPPENALTNNAKPAITLGFDMQCFGVPCGFSPDYYASYSLTANLNNLAVSSLFSFDVVTGQSNYTPSNVLPEGQSSFNAQAQDSFGHVSNVIDTTFTIDTIPPKFSAISPTDGSTFTAPEVIISGTVDDALATIVLDGIAGPVTGPNFSFPVSLAWGSNTLNLSAIDTAGNQTSVELKLTYTYSSNLVSVTVASPVSGATISSDTVLVSGTFLGPANTGITVNGAVAAISANQFYATVPLQSGENTITVTATTTDGATVNQTITVTSTGPALYRAIAEPFEGAAPLKVGFSVENTSGLTVAEIDIDFDGNGSIDLSVYDLTSAMEYTYTTPGVYTAKFDITNSSGFHNIVETTVVVQDPGALDDQFKVIWDGMNGALNAQNKTTALTYLNQAAQAKYGPVFDTLLPYFPGITASYSALQRVSISPEIGEYAVSRVIDGVEQVFFIYFLRDADGVWRLDAM